MGNELVWSTDNNSVFEHTYGSNYFSFCLASEDSPFFNTSFMAACPSRSTITSRQQCELAARALGHNQQNITSEDEYPHLPGGCIARADELIWSRGNLTDFESTHGS